MATGKIRLDVGFEEFNMTAKVSYMGNAPVLPTARPSEEELIADEGAVGKLSGFLVRRYARRIQVEQKNGMCHVEFSFEH